MSEMEHTPTPWMQYMHGPMIHGADGFYIGIMQSKNADKDAAYTVECVNSHASLVEENARLREALTPSGETKGEYMGEFSISLPDFDENGIEYTRKINVPWTTIKEIMAAIKARAEALK